MSRWFIALCLAALTAACNGEEFVAGPTTDGGAGGDSAIPVEGWDKKDSPAVAPLPICEPLSAPVLFKDGLCLCGDLRNAGAVLVREGQTPRAPKMGLNGAATFAAYISVDGTVVAHRGLEAAAYVEVRDDFVSGGSVAFAGKLEVGRNLMVGGNLAGIGALEVGGTLGVAGANLVIGGRTVKASGAYVPAPGPPCTCEKDQLLDIAAEVAQAKAQNDNQKAHLPTTPTTVIGGLRLVLNSGRYYFGSTAGLGYKELVVNGAVKLYIDSDVDGIGYDRFTIKEGSALDVYVAGNLRTVGHMVYGDHHHPSALRIYVGGSESLNIQVGNQLFRGSIYAPNAPLTYVGRTQIDGALFAKSLDSAGLLELSFSRPTTGLKGERCTVPGEEPPKSSDLPDPDKLPDIENM